MYLVRLPELLYREIMIHWMQLYFTLHWKRRQSSGDCTGRKNWYIHVHSSQYLSLPFITTITSVMLLKTYVTKVLVLNLYCLFFSPGLRRMPKWQTFSTTTSAKTDGGKQHWKMPFLFWESKGSSILQPSSF